MRCALGIAFAIAGCGDIFDVERVGPAPDAPAAPADADSSICFEDDFETGINPAWVPWGQPAVETSTANGSLLLSIQAATSASKQYGGLYTSPRDFTGVSAEIQFKVVPPGPAEIVLQFTKDAMNLYSLSVAEGVLSTQKQVDGALTDGRMAYSAERHRFARMRHDTVANEMVFEARGLRVDPWVEVGRVGATLPLAGMYFEVFAGSYGTNVATQAEVDDVLLLGACP